MIHYISRFIAALALLAAAQGAWAWSGSGTAESPYQITSTADLDQLATDVNSGTEHEGDYFVLTTDLTYSHTTDWNDANSTENNYTPIGGQYDQKWRYFNGHFDGQGHTISGIRIYKSGGTTAEQCMGLFGRINGGADVKNVFLADARITANDYSGPIVGYNYGRVENCHVLSDVTVHAVTASADYHGGVVGYNTSSGTITGCTSAASITAAASCKYNGGITGQGSGTVEDCIYFGSTVAGDSYVGAIIGYPASGSTIRNCYYINDGIASATGYNTTSATVTDVRLATSDDFAVSGDTYTIGTAAGWSVMCAALYHNDTYNRFSGKTVQLGADITVTRMAGGSNHAFTGTFDGQWHTLTLDYGTADAPIDAQFVAPFVETANDGEHQPTFRNLTIGGTIYECYTGSAEHNVGGLIGHLYGNVTIEHCTSNVSINATSGAGGFVGLCEHSVSFNDCHSAAVIRSADGSNSGFVAWSRASAYTIAFTGCLFDGKLLQQNGSGSYNGGFIGWTGSTKTVTITNSLCAPAPLATGETMASSGSATFARGWNATTTATNCYDTAAFEIAQGKATRTVTAAAADVTIEAVALTGTATQYTVSGITAYSGGGLQLGQTLYYGSDDQLSLTLSTSAQCDQPGYQYAYTASAGTLIGSTLTMPDQDVTISVNTAELAPIDWTTVNKGNSAEDPYMIYNKDQLLLLAHRVNGTNGETANDYSRKYFKLGADITFDPNDLTLDEGQSNYEAIGGYIGGTYRYFRGTFIGDGHTVSGIRIRKDGSDNADCYQGLFGRISSGAVILDVHLTDARITGCYYVGGIIGYNTGTGYVSGCTVTDSYITATDNRNYGTICGSISNTLRNNYYHGCTVNGTAATSGVGCQGADIADNHGALPAYRLDLGANITTPPGTFVNQTGWLDTPPVNPRLAPENGFTLAGNHYFASGYVFTPGSTLASGAALGYTPRATLGGQLLDLYTHTGDAPDYTGTAIARLTITADCDGKTLAAALRSDGLEHEVSYMTADGSTQTAQAVALDGHETNLAAGWYFVGKDISYNATLTLTGDVTLILADGKTMNIGTSESRISGHGIARESGGDQALTIYGQNAGTGALNVYTDNGNRGIVAKAVTINGGNVTIDANGNDAAGISAGDEDITINGGHVSVTAPGTDAWAIYAYNNVTINGGTVEASGTADGIRIDNGTISINGGTVNASGDTTGDDSGYGINASYGFGTITLGWSKPTDRITASSYSSTVAVKDGQALTDGSGHVYTGTLSADDLAALAGKTLQPWLVLNETDGVTPLTALAGQANVPVIFARTFSANVASTICLPFAISAEQAAAAGKFYTFAGVETSGSDWVVTMQEANAANAALAANTPYLFMPSASSEVTFSGTIGNVADTYTAGTTTSGDWTYRGTYKTIEWPSDPGNIYGFASGQAYGNTGDQTAAGKFIRVHTGGIRPFRAYLEYNGSAGARAMSGSASSHELPETMTVRLIGADGQTSAIGALDTRTGEATFGTDAWYTLDGRRLSGKPAAKGLYIKNGKKTVIK